MKKLVTIFSLIILAFVGVMISGCGDKYEKLSLSISTSIASQNGVITLVIGDNELGTMEITANVNNAPKNFNYKSSFVSLMGKVAVSSLIEDVDKGSKVTITPIYPGEDTIAITTSEGDKVEYVRVRVIKRATSINFASEDISLVRGSTTENFAQYIEVEDSDANETLINNFSYKFMLSPNIELSEEQSRQITIDGAGNLYISNDFESSSFVVKAMLGTLETQFKTINVLSQVENINVKDYSAGDIVDLYSNDNEMYYKTFNVTAESDSKIILDYDNLGEGDNKWFDISSELKSSGPYYTWNVKISAVKNVASAINNITYPLQLRFVYASNNQIANSTTINLRSSSAPNNYVLNNINTTDNSIDVYSNDEVGVSYFSISHYNQSEILGDNQSFKLSYDKEKIALYTQIDAGGEIVPIDEVSPDTRIYIKANGLTLGAAAEIKIVPKFYDGQDAYTKTITARYSSGVTEIYDLKLSGDGVYPKTEDGTTTYYINLDEAIVDEAKIGLNYEVQPDRASKKTIYIKSSNNNIVYGDVDDKGNITIYPSQVGEVTLTVGTSNIVGGAEKSIKVVVYRKIADFTFNITGDNIKYIGDTYYVKDNTISQMSVNVEPLDARYTTSYKVKFTSTDPGIEINGKIGEEITIDNGTISSLNITNDKGIVEGTIEVTVTDQYGDAGTKKQFNIVFYKPITNVSVSVDKKNVYSGDNISYFDSYDYLTTKEAKNVATFTLKGTGYEISSKSIIIQKDGKINHTELKLNDDNQYISNDNVILELIQTGNEYSLVVYSFPCGYPATISVKFVLVDKTGTMMPKFASVRINDVTKVSNISAQEYDNQDMIFWGIGKTNNLTLTYSSSITTLTEEILIFQKDASGNFIDTEKELLVGPDITNKYGYPAIVYKNGLTLKSQEVGSGYLYIVPKDNIKSFSEDNGFEFYDDTQNKTIAVNIGDGSNENAFVITSAQQMINLDTAYYYKLGNNITLDNRFTTLGEFKKTFDGNGYTITINNISPNDSNDYALFSTLENGGIIRNLNIIANYDISTSNAINLGGIVVTNNGTITNCKVIANYNITSSTASNIGGVVATNNGNITGTYTESSEITFGTDSFDINLNVTINGTITFGGVAASNTGTIQNMSVGGKVDYSSATADKVKPISDNAGTNNYYFVTINGVKQISDDIDDINFDLTGKLESDGGKLSQNTNGDYFIAFDSSNKEYLTNLLNITPVAENNTRYNAVLKEGSNIALIEGGSIKIFGTGKIVINVNSIYDENNIKSITIYVINKVSNFGIYKDANLGSEISELSFYVASGYGSIYLNTIDTNGVSIPSSQLMVKFESNNATVVNTTIDNNSWSLQNGTYYIMLPYKNVYSIESTTKLETTITINLYYNVNGSIANDVIVLSKTEEGTLTASENLTINVKTGASELTFANNKDNATISQRSTYELVVSAKTDDQFDDIIVSYSNTKDTEDTENTEDTEDTADINFSVNFLSNGTYDSENGVLSKTFYITYKQDEPITEDKKFTLTFTTSSNKGLSKQFSITITPQAVESVDSAFFGMHKKDPNEKEGDWLYINPSNVQVDGADARWGLLEYYVYPHYANYDYFIIESSSEYLQMDAIKLSNTSSNGYVLDTASYEKISNNAIKVYYRAGYFDNGITDNDPTYSFRQLYNIRLIIDNRAEHMQEITLTTRFFKNDGTEYVIKDNKPITLYAIKDSVLEVSLQDQSLMYGSGDNATAYIPFGTQEALSINASEFDNNVSWNIYTKNDDNEEIEVYSEVQVVLNNGVYQLIVDDDMDIIGKEYTIRFNATKVVYGTQKTYTKELKVLVTLFTVTDITVNNLNNDILTGMTYYNTPLEVKLSLKYDENSYTKPYEITADSTTNIKQSIDKLLSAINSAVDNGSSKVWSYKSGDTYTNIKNGDATSIFEVSQVTNGLFYLIGKQDNQVIDFKMKVGVGVSSGILQYTSENVTKTFEKDFKVVFTEQTSIDNAIPVYNQTDFENMEDDKDYILMNDIYLDNYSPISNEIHSFDGNNKTIYITSSTYSDYIQNNNNVKIALFDTVSENTIIKNVTLRYVNSAEYKIDGAVDIEIPTKTNGIIKYNNGNFDTSLESDEYFKQDTNVNDRYLYADSIFITLLRDKESNVIIGSTINYGTATIQLNAEQLNTLNITRISEKYEKKGVLCHYFIIEYSNQTIHYNNTVKKPTGDGSDNEIENKDSQPNENNYTKSSVIADTNTCIITFNNDVTEIRFAGIAVVNNGTITNAKIYGKVNLDYLETSTVPTTYNAGLVVTNNGYITNSAVGTQDYSFEFTGTGQLAGFVWTNGESGKISSSYVDNIYLIRKYSAKEGDGTAGFVYVNNGTINACYTRGANSAGNSSIMYNDGGISAIGIASAFVFTNNNEINDCFTNVKIFASGSACGFVYRNETNSIVTNSYSISMLNGSSSSNTPFEGVSIDGGEIAYNNGTIEYCYYLDGSAVHTNGTSATRLTTSQFAKIDSFPTFNINQYADDSTPYVWEMVGGSPKLVATMTDTISERELVSKSKNYSSIVDFPYLKSVDNESNIETWYNGVEELTIYKSLDNSVLSALYNGKVISTSDIERVSQQLNVQEDEGETNTYLLSFNNNVLTININNSKITIQEQDSTSNIPVSGSGNTYYFVYQNITFTLITNNNSKPTVSYNYYRLAVVDNVIYNYRYQDYALGTKENPFIIYDATSYNAYIEGYNYIDNGVTIYGNNNNQKGYYRLIKDIDIYQQFVTTSNKIFAGIFDGNNMQISNVAIINNPDIGVQANVDGFGLFANTQNAIIKNLYVSIAEVASSKHVYVGGVIGKMSGGNLSNIHVNIAEGRNGIVMGTNIVGGVVGYATNLNTDDIRLYNIYSSVKVNSTLFTDSTNNKIKYLVVNNQYSNFNEVSYAGAILGAINGDIISDNQNHAQNLYVTAPSTVSGRTAGGVIGIVLKDTKVKNINLEVSSEDQFVRATYYMGGLIGENRGYVDIAEATYSQDIIDAINTAQIAQTPTSIYDEYFRSPSSSETYETTVAMGGLIGLNIGGSLTNANAMVSVRNTTTQFAGGAIGRAVGYGNISKVVASNTVKSNIIMGGLIGSVMSFESFTNLLVSDKKITDTDTTLVAWLKSKYNENEYNYDTQYNTINSDLSINDCKAVGNLRQADTYYLYPQSDINRSYGAFIGLIYYKAEEQANNSMAYEAPSITGENNYSINTLYNVVNPNYNNEQYFFVPLAYYSSLYSGVSSRLLDGAIINDEEFANIVIDENKKPITLQIEGVKHHEILKGVKKDKVNKGDSKEYKVDIVYVNNSYKFTSGSNTQYARVIVKDINTGNKCVYIDGVKYPNNNYSVEFTYNGLEGNINNVTNVEITAKDDITEIANTKSEYYSGFGAPQWVLDSTNGNENNYYTLVKNVAIENWKDYATTPSKDVNNIYEISNAQELAWLINNPDASAILTADIDLSGRYWKPIDNYTGTFDGNGKTIRYATVNSLGNSGSNYDYAGIFGQVSKKDQVSGTVKNLTTEYGTIEGEIAGGVVGHLNGGTLENITNNNQVIATSMLGGVVGNITSGTATSLVNNGAISLNQTNNGTYYVGGVVGNSVIDLSGHKNNGAINVQVDNKDATLYVGGVVGNAEGKDVNGCTSQNGRITISTNAKLYAGGVVGYVTTINGTNTTGNYSDMYISFNRQYYDSDIPKLNVGGVAGYAITSVNKAFNVGNINLNLQYNVFSNLDIKAGGVVGGIENSTTTEGSYTITESYNVGNINVSNAITSNTIYVGGITAYLSGGKINSCYNMGAITADRNNIFIGGLLGRIDSSTVSNSYNNGKVSLTYVDYEIKDGSSTKYNNGMGSLAGYIGNNAVFNNSHWTLDSIDYDYGAGLVLDSENKGNKSSIPYSTLSKTQTGLNIENFELVVASWYPTLINNKSQLMWRNYTSSFTYQNGAFIISTPEELAYLSSQVNSGNLITEGVIFRLTNDLDMSNRYFTPIGTQTNPFKGTFEGNNYSIKNLTISASIDDTISNIGLFGYTQNANITGVSIVNNYYEDNVNNNYEDNEESVTTIIGGIIAVMDGGQLSNSFVENTNSAYTNFNRNNSKTILGGLVGQIKGQSTINITYANYVMTLSSTTNVGNFVGKVDTDANLTISNSYLTKGVEVVIDGQYNGLIGNSSGEVVLHNIFMFKKQDSTGEEPQYEVVVYENNSEKTLTDEVDLQNREGWDYTNIWTFDEYTMNDTYPSLRGLGQNWAEQLVDVVVETDNVYGVEDATNKHSGYIISDEEDLAYIMQNINNGVIDTKGKYFVLKKIGKDEKDVDINLSGKYWTPIGTNEYPFEGVFDFNGHSISNMVIDSKNADYAGLFGNVVSYNQANIAKIMDSKNDIATPTKNINNAFVKNTMTDDKISYVGGLAGKVTNANIDNIVTDYVRVMGLSSSSSYSVNVGGLVGGAINNISDAGQITNVRVLNSSDKTLILSKTLLDQLNIMYINQDDDTGTVPSYQVVGVGQYLSSNVGGLVGYINGVIKTDENIYMLETNVNVLAYTQQDSNGFANAGGLVGYINGGANIAYAISGKATNHVTAISTKGTYVGGAVGELSNGTIGSVVNNTTIATNTSEYRYMGGIVGEVNYATVYHLINLGSILTSNFNNNEIVGSLIGNVTARTTTIEDARLTITATNGNSATKDKSINDSLSGYSHIGAIQLYLDIPHDILNLDTNVPGKINFNENVFNTTINAFSIEIGGYTFTINTSGVASINKDTSTTGTT